MDMTFARSTFVAACAIALLACGGGKRPVVVADTSAVARAGVVVLSGSSSLDAALRDAYFAAGGGRVVEVVDERPEATGGVVAFEFDPKAAANLGARPRMALCPGDAMAVANAIGAGTGVWFGDVAGGDVEQCVLGTREIVDAVARHRATGGVVGGGGRGADILGKWVVPETSSADAIGTGFPQDLARGLGLADEFVVHSGTFERGTLGALVMAMAETKSDWGLGLDADAGVAIDVDRKRMKIVGSAPIVLVDLSDAKIHGGRRSVENGRVSLLCPDDSFSLEARQVRFVAAKTRTSGPPTGNAEVENPDQAWTEASLRNMFARLAKARSGSVGFATTRAGLEHRFVLTVDERTQSFEALAPDSVSPAMLHTITNLRLDIVPLYR